MTRVGATLLGLLAACATARGGAEAPVAVAHPPVDDAMRTLPFDHRVIARRDLRDATLVLTLDPAQQGALFVIDDGHVYPVPCDRLPHAWGLWLDDVDGDGRAEAIVALHRPARFDPGDHHRLHVYALERGRCVPLWRGTRLAGRFDAATVVMGRRAALLVHEWTSPSERRIARYRWTGFGYALDEIVWHGSGEPPIALTDLLDHPPDRVTP
jgi:hypothetical protein